MKRRETTQAMAALAALLLVGACANAGARLSPTPATGSPTLGSPPSTVSRAASRHDLAVVPPAPDYAGTITADGATFPQPVYERWLARYNAQAPAIQISYAGGGSGQGIKDITADLVQFAGSDAPMTSAERQAAEARNGSPILHIPTVFGAVVLAYDLPGLGQIDFSPEVIGGIFAGRITAWDDPAIAADNPGLRLPATPITVVHRSDGSGTTNAFTSWLCAASHTWKEALGATSCAGKEVRWPVGLGGKGNPGVTAQVTQTAGAIGYVELAYAMQNGLTYGRVGNSAGRFIAPTLASVAAAADFATIPADLTFEAWGSAVPDAYPITTATWLLVYQAQDRVSHDAGRSAAVVHFLIWALDRGAPDATALAYAPLPDRLRAAALASIATITWNGQPIVDSLYRP